MGEQLETYGPTTYEVSYLTVGIGTVDANGLGNAADLTRSYGEGGYLSGPQPVGIATTPDGGA